MPRGVFLSLDGPDGGGKSTGCRLLIDWLRGRGESVVPCADPGGTSLGTVLRDILLQQRHDLAAAAEALLFMASRAQLVHEVIRPALDAGRVVVCDRFLLANVVYQGYAGGLDVAHLWQAGRLSTGGLEPDLTLVLDVPVEVAVARRTRPADRLESRDAAYHERVRAGFLAEVARDPARRKRLDATRPADEVQDDVRREVRAVLERRAADGVGERPRA